MAWGSLLLFVIAFAILVRLHGRVLNSLRKHRIYLSIKRQHIARIRRHWEGLGPPVDISISDRHPFAADLDILGARSLHHLVDTAATVKGSKRLAGWLTQEEPDIDAAIRRGDLVRSLMRMGPFRDRLSLLGSMVRHENDEPWEGDELVRWLDNHADAPGMLKYLYGLSALSVLTLILFIAWATGPVGTWWLLTLLVYATVYITAMKHVAHLFEEAEHLYFEIHRFRPILLYLEGFSFAPESPLRELCAPFKQHPRPSTILKRIGRLAAAAGTQKSELVRLALNILIPWDLLFSYRLARYKDRVRHLLPRWLDAWRTLEASSSLATFGALNAGFSFASYREAGSFETDRVVPDHTAPDRTGQDHTAPDRTGQDRTVPDHTAPDRTVPDHTATAPLFEALDLGHPLLPPDEKVSNSFRLERTGSLALITGSNMSGKSTFLRTAGVNLVLAYAGGPVDAASLSTVPMRIFSCINVTDSVNDGISYFYAEVKRLRSLLDEMARKHPDPVLFLVDEIFRGTNNRERLIGSRAFLRALSGGFGAGLVSTHDLELVALEDEIESLRNYHFRETIVEGRMEFDYRLHPGPCPTTNALRIMELEGLPTREMDEDGR